MPMTNYLANAIMSEIFRGTNYVPPSTIYVALYSITPTRAGGGLEINYLTKPSYARQSAVFDAPSGGVILNTDAVHFPGTGNATENWGTIDAIGFLDAASAGNLLWYAPTAVAPFPVGTGTSVTFPSASLRLSLL